MAALVYFPTILSWLLEPSLHAHRASTIQGNSGRWFNDGPPKQSPPSAENRPGLGPSVISPLRPHSVDSPGDAAVAFRHGAARVGMGGQYVEQAETVRSCV